MKLTNEQYDTAARVVAFELANMSSDKQIGWSIQRAIPMPREDADSLSQWITRSTDPEAVALRTRHEIGRAASDGLAAVMG